jgi:hypothetical protein
MQSGLCDMFTFWSGVDRMLTKYVPSWRSPMPNRGATMSSLDFRLKKLETAAGTVHLAKLTDTELDSHILTLKDGSPGWYDAIIHKVLRYPSAFPVVHDDPDQMIAGGSQA